MKKRIICGLLATMLVWQTIPQTVYGMELAQPVIEIEKTDQTLNTVLEQDVSISSPEPTTMQEVTETPEPVETNEPEEIEESIEDIEPISTATPGAEVLETIEPTMVPDETPTQTPENAEETITPSVLPTEIPEASPSAEAESSPIMIDEENVTPSSYPTLVPYVEDVGETSTDTIEQLTLNEEYSLSIAAGENEWMQFTAPEAGEYIFYNANPMNVNLVGGLYKNMSDAVPVETGGPIRYSSGWYAIYTMSANETIYWNLGFSTSYSSGTVKVNVVKKDMELKGTFSEPVISEIPYGFQIDIDFTSSAEDNLAHGYGVNNTFITLAYSTNKDADFAALNDWIKIGGYANNTTPPDDIEVIGFSSNGVTSDLKTEVASYVVNTKSDTEMKPDTTYYYAIFSNVVDYDDAGYYGAYYWKQVYSGEVVSGSGIEKSNVTIDADFETEAGYSKMYLKASITNPNDEAIIEKGFKLLPDGSSTYIYGYASYYGNETDVFYGRILFGEYDTYSVTPYVKVREGADGTETEICGEAKTITRKDTSDLKNLFTVVNTSSGANLDYNFNVNNNADDTIDYSIKYGKTSGEYENTYRSGLYVNSSEAGIFRGKIKVPYSDALEAGVEYKFSITLYDSSYDTVQLYHQEGTFTPKGVITYTEEDFPDETFRALIQNKVGEGEEITSDKLEKITSLSLDTASDYEKIGAESAIKSIEGIEYLTNLTSIWFNGNDISDISMLPKLKYLANAYLEYNDITKIPDFSNSEYLTTLRLSYNLIPDSEFVKEKYPEVYINKWGEGYLSGKGLQRDSNQLVISDYYYQKASGNVLFLGELTGTKVQREWEVKLSINGNTYTVPAANTYQKLFKSLQLEIENLPAGTYDVVITAQESYGGRTLSVEKKIEIKEADVIYHYKEHINNIDGKLDINDVYWPCLSEDETLSAIKLVDKNGNVIGKPYINSMSDYVTLDDIYPNVFRNDIVLDDYLYWHPSASYLLGTYDLSGSYNLIIETSKKTYIIEDYATTDYDEPVVTYVTYSINYDNAGDYFYMVVRGEGLNCDKFYPVLVADDGTEVTEFVSWTNGDNDNGGSGDATFKLRKLDGFISDATMGFKFVSLEDYPEIKCIGIDKTIYTSTGDEIVKLVYNYKAKEYVLYASSKVPLGTELSITVSDYYTYEVYGVGKTALSNGKTTVNIQTEDGEFFECDPYYYYYYRYNVSGQAVIDGELKEINCGGYIIENSGGFMGTGTTEEVKESIGYTGEFYQQSGTALTAEFTVYNNVTYTQGDVATLTLAQYDAINKTYTTVATTTVSASVNETEKKAVFNGKFTSTTAFTAGQYRVSLTNASGKLLQIGTIMVYANSAIYQHSQYNGHYYGEELSIQAGFISNKSLDKAKFSFEFYDINKNRITNWSLASATKINTTEADYQYWQFKFNNLPGKYSYLYCKIKYDGKVISDSKNPSVSYYAAQGHEEEYGMGMQIYSGITFSTTTGIGYTTVISDFVSDYTVEIYSDETATLITKFNVPYTGYYYFTEENLAPVIAVDPELDELYTLVAKKFGAVLVQERFVNIGYKKVNPITATGISLSKKEVALDKDASIQLTATITPANATDKTVVWSSDNEAVATVTQDGLVKAVGYGKAVIKATTSNGKSASCTITVAMIEPTSVKLSETAATMKINNTLQLNANIKPDNATVKTLTWTSSAEGIATVDENGLITALAPGKATITAETVNGKKSSCVITVYNPDGGKISLKPAETAQLQLSDGINTKGAKYTSSNTSVATVSTSGLVSAVGIGETNITFTSGEIIITYTVTVTNPLQSIAFEENMLTIEVNDTITNSIVFDPVYTDSDKTLGVDVDNEEIASATVLGDKIIQIIGLKEGNATVTVSCGELTANCEVIVQNSVAVPDTSEHMVYALTNRDKTLADISGQLMSGFEFQNPEIELSKFAGESEKEFAVIYTDESGRKKQGIQNVKFLTISGIMPTIDMQSVEVGSEMSAKLVVTCLWSGYKAEDDVKEQMLRDYEFIVTPSNEGIIEIQKNEDGFWISGMKEGKIKINVVLRKKDTEGKNGILYQEKLDFAVSEKVADIQLEVMGAAYNEEGDYYYVNDIQTAAVSVKATADNYKLTWSSSDTGIAKVEKSIDGVSAVTLKNNGKVRLTVTANDAGKTAKSIMLYIIDTKPSVDTSMTINKAHENGGTIGIYASYDYDIRQYDVQLMLKGNPDQSDDRFAIDYNSEKDIYEVVILNNDSVPQGKYSVVVKVTATTDAGEKEYLSDLLITVIDKPVTYTDKQSEKVNLFFADEEGNGVLDITCKNAVLESVELVDCDFAYDYETASLAFEGSDYKNADTAGTLIVKFEGYKEVSKNIVIKTEIKKPSVNMSVTSSVLYPNVGIKKAQVQIMDKSTGTALWIENRNINQENLDNDAYRVYASEGTVYLELKENIVEYPKSAKVKFAIQMDNWNEEVTFTHTVKCNLSNNPTLALSNSKLTLNKNAAVARYQEADVEVKVKDATENVIGDVTVSGTDKNALNAMNQGIDFDFASESGTLTASFNNSNAVAKGTYNYAVRTEITEDKSITTKLKVSVIDKATTVAVSTKGSIDILDRKNTSIVCTPKLKDISGEIVDVTLTGRDAHLFEVALNESGKAVITARSDVAYITKYAYNIQLLYTLKSGERTYAVSSKPMSIKVKQGKANITFSLSSSLLYQAADNALNLNLTALNSNGKSLDVKEVSIVEAKETKGAFEVSYNEATECYQLLLKDATKVKKGKTYSLKMNVRLNDQADNEKATTITVKVTVK